MNLNKIVLSGILSKLLMKWLKMQSLIRCENDIIIVLFVKVYGKLDLIISGVQEGVRITLDCAQAAFVSYDKLVLSLKGGEL